jgi:hypothetical protein
MPGKAAWWSAAAAGEVDAAEVERELRAQLAWFRHWNGGQYPTHIDGHNHIEVVPVVAEVMSRVMSELGIRFCRRPCQPLSTPHWRDALSDGRRAFLQRVYGMARATHAQHFGARGLLSTRQFVGHELVGGDNSADTMLALLRRLADTGDAYAAGCDAGCVSDDDSDDDDDDIGGDTDHEAAVLTVEIMTHPGNCSPASISCSSSSSDGAIPFENDEFSQSPDREHEMAVLCHPAVVALVRELQGSKRLFLTDFAQLASMQ